MMKRILDRRSFHCAARALLLLLLCTSGAASAQSIKLDQNWQLYADREGTAKLESLSSVDQSAWRPVRVGLSWNAQFADLRDYMGVAWYRTRFVAPQVKTEGHVLVRFGAVDYYCEVFVNGQRVGTHEGGYTPFDFDITSEIKPGANELLMRVVDPPMDEKENKARFPDMLYNEIPHGKQNWYVQTGGIWQPVTLEVKPRLYIEQVHVTPRVNGDVGIEVVVSAGKGFSAKFNQDLKVTVRNPVGGVEFTRTLRASDADPQPLSGHVTAPKLWSPDHPSLYSIEVALEGSAPDIITDSVTDRFGFRSFEARDRQFYLNGEPFYMVAALDQDFYPETIYTPPSEEYVREMMLKGKRLGLNLLRCHIKVPDPVYLKVADEVGMLVWYEIPSWNDFNHFSPKAAARGEQTFAAEVQRDWNHPSIVIQSIINESWGTDLKQADQREWLRAAFERAKQLTAPLGRLIVDNSACCDNFHVRTDIEDNHRYNSIPDDHAAFDKWVADFSTHPKWNFSPHGDAVRTGKEPLVLSEFGNWGLPRLPKDLPWWFGRDFAGREVTRPLGLFERFKEFQFARLFKDYNTLAEETEWHQFISLKHEIEEIRSHAPIQGYVITEFTDINWEANGLMDMWRNPKVYATELAKIQQPDVILARPQKVNYMSGERIEVQTLLSHYSAKELSGARLQWSTDSGEGGRFLINGPIRRAAVAPLQAVAFNAPQVTNPRRERLLLEIRGRDNSLIAENSCDFFIYPPPHPAREVVILFHDPKGSISELGRGLKVAGYAVGTPGVADVHGYRVVTDIKVAPGLSSLIISSVLDEWVAQRLGDGARVLLVLNTNDALPAGSPFKVTPRAGSDLDGNWVTNFNWIRTEATPFKPIAFNRVLGFEADAVTPAYVIQGVRGEDYADVMSGIFYGWLNNNAALAVQMRDGEGKIFATTYRFNAYGRDPFATHLLDAIIRYASGPDFAPKLKM